jgi:hypothetical protein
MIFYDFCDYILKLFLFTSTIIQKKSSNSSFYPILSFFNMLDTPASPCPLSPSATATASDDGDLSPSTTLYQSLEAAMRHPSCVSPTWIDTISDFKNNPHTLHSPPYNDGALHWVDNNDDLLHMAFPAVLDLYGKYAKVGPYFSLMGEQPFRVNISLSSTIFSSNTFLETNHSYFKQN